MLSNLIIALTLVAQTKAEPLPERASVEYFKDLDVTSIDLDLSFVSNDAGSHLLSIYTGHKGRDPQAAKEVALHIARWGPHWVYQKSHDVQVTCGDDKLKIRKVDYMSEENPKHPKERCNEFIDIRAPAADLQKILKRDRDLKVEIGGRQSYILHEPTRTKILKFVKAVRSGGY